MTRILITGASRGVGHAFNLGLARPGDSLWLVSRTAPRLDPADGAVRHWIPADLTQTNAADVMAEALAGGPLDALIYNAGIWERQAFSSRYRLEAVPEAETLDVLTVNLTAPLLCVQKLLPNLRQSPAAKIVLIGSTSGLDNAGTPEVAYNASKMGLRGLALALRENLRADRIPVTILNPGSISTADAPYEDGREAALAASGGALIPVHDLVALVRCLLDLSNATCVKEIDVPAMADTNA